MTRHRSDATRPFERARRGDVLVVSDPPDRDITSSGPVDRIAVDDP